jgi:hypothetical protein
MVTIEKAAEVLGLTPRQVYRRISSVRPLLEPYLRRGRNGALLLDGSALEMLKRAEALRRDGLTLAEAVSRIVEEIGGNGRGEPGQAIGEPPESSVWRLLLEEKDRRIEALEREVAFLRARVEELLPRALPPPRRRWWWPWGKG